MNMLNLIPSVFFPQIRFLFLLHFFRKSEVFVACDVTEQQSEYQPFIDKMKVKLSSDVGKVVYGKRKVVVEPVIGNMSYNLGFREFFLRGLEKVKGEYALMCIAHNLWKMQNFLRELGLGLKEALAHRRDL